MKTLNKSASFSFLLSLVLTIFIVCGVNKALAAPQPLPFDFEPGIGNLVWDGINNDYGDPLTGSPFSGDCDEGIGTGLAINDADNVGPDDDEDAYDTAWLTTLNNTFVGTSGVGDLRANTYTAVPVNISGLNVIYQLFFSADTLCNRLVVFFDNNTGSPISDTFRIATNFGSDDDTVINGTSSGDNVFTTADRWIVTSDGFPADDPVNTTVFYGPGNPEVTPNFATQTVCDDSDRDGVGAAYDITVPANESRCLMFFACLGDITQNLNTIEGALAAAPLFNSNSTIPGDLLFSNQPIRGCLNWDFGSVTAIPTLSEWGLIAMAGVLGIIGFFVLRRRVAAKSGS